MSPEHQKNQSTGEGQAPRTSEEFLDALDRWEKWIRMQNVDLRESSSDLEKLGIIADDETIIQLAQDLNRHILDGNSLKTFLQKHEEYQGVSFEHLRAAYELRPAIVPPENLFIGEPEKPVAEITVIEEQPIEVEVDEKEVEPSVEIEGDVSALATVVEIPVNFREKYENIAAKYPVIEKLFNTESEWEQINGKPFLERKRVGRFWVKADTDERLTYYSEKKAINEIAKEWSRAHAGEILGKKFKGHGNSYFLTQEQVLDIFSLIDETRGQQGLYPSYGLTTKSDIPKLLEPVKRKKESPKPKKDEKKAKAEDVAPTRDTVVPEEDSLELPWSEEATRRWLTERHPMVEELFENPESWIEDESGNKLVRRSVIEKMIVLKEPGDVEEKLVRNRVNVFVNTKLRKEWERLKRNDFGIKIGNNRCLEYKDAILLLYLLSTKLGEPDDFGKGYKLTEESKKK